MTDAIAQGLTFPTTDACATDDAAAGQSGSAIAGLSLLLTRMGWTGTTREIDEALPWRSAAERRESVTLDDIRNVAARLGFISRTERRAGFTRRDLKHFLGRRGMALHIPDTGPPVVVEAVAGGFSVFGLGAANPVPAQGVGAGVMLGLSLASPADTPSGPDRRGWLRPRLGAAMPLVAAALALTLCANLLALTSPLFVMAIYDKVIAAESVDILTSLSAGAVGALVLETVMRRLRSRIMAHAGTRLGYIVGNAVLARLLSLPSLMTERVAVAAQVARVKDLDRVRDLLTGPLAQACLDLPFALVFLGVIFAIGGWLGLVPLTAAIIYAVVAFAGNAWTRNSVAVAATAGARRQELMLEIVDRMRAIRATGTTAVWNERCDAIATRAAEATFRNAQAAAALGTLSQTMATFAGLATLAFGIGQVLAGHLTTGGLIGAMMLVWRMLGPLQGAFIASTRLGQLRASLRQIETLMATQPEQAEAPTAERAPVIRGGVSFSRVTFRYGRESEPILANISFDVEPGEVVAVVGRNGGGKSTVLKLVSGLYIPQGGSVRIDGRDLRQFDPMVLRRSIAFAPQTPQFFDGTLADNLRLVAPEADTAALRKALDHAGALEAVDALPDGLDTRFDTRAVPLPTGLLARLSLARVHLRKAPLVLLDEPAAGFDFEGEFAFTSTIEALRGRSTVFFVTHRRGHLGMADKVLIIENGTTRYFGTADKVRDRIPKGLI